MTSIEHHHVEKNIGAINSSVIINRAIFFKDKAMIQLPAELKRLVGVVAKDIAMSARDLGFDSRAG